MEDKPRDLKRTVNLPRTDFPMKANLPQAEPKLLDRWEKENLYGKIRTARAGRPMPNPEHSNDIFVLNGGARSSKQTERGSRHLE